jgi:hypothetical protein
MINQPCPDAQYSIETTIGILKPLEFNGAGLLTSGAWTQPVREEGCGKSRRLNVLALSKNETQIATQALLPGTTRADPLLQRDALTNLFTVAQIVVHEPNDTCKTQYVSDTEFLGEAGQPREGAQHPPWREMWTVSSCTKRSAVRVLFTPGAVGTSFVIGPQNAVNVVPLE